MIDFVAVRNTIATSTDVELLRGTLVLVLGVADQRRATVASIDPIVEPVFRQETSDSIRSVLPQTRDVEVMRSLLADAFKGVEALDVQIARLRLS